MPTKRVIVLRAAKHIIERRRVVSRDVIELGDGQIALETNSCAVVTP